MRFLVFISASLSALSLVAAQETQACPNQQTISSTLVGANHDVVLQQVQCSNALQAEPAVTRFSRRQDNVCGAACDTNCFSGTDTGPNPDDCTVIADALLYEGENTGALFTLDPSNNTTMLTMQYQTCTSFILNQANTTLQYCRSAWSELTNYLAQNCQATQDAHGGNCVAEDQRWFVQVQRT